MFSGENLSLQKPILLLVEGYDGLLKCGYSGQSAYELCRTSANDPAIKAKLTAISKTEMGLVSLKRIVHGWQARGLQPPVIEACPELRQFLEPDFMSW